MATKADVHVGDIGTYLDIPVLEGTTPVSLVSATLLELVFLKKDKTTLTVTPSFKTDGSDGVLRYTFKDGDLDQAGVWQFQVYIVLPSGSWHTSIGEFTVSKNLK